MESNPNYVDNVYTEIVQRLSKKQKFSYGVGHVLNDICASMWFSYLLVFFHFVLGFDPVLSGMLMLIGQVADAFATPFVGLQSDRIDDFWLCRYGKRKTWHLTGTMCVVLSFPFIFSKCIHCGDASQWSQLVYYSAFVMIFQIGWASVQISHLALIPDLTPTEHERTELTAIRYTFTVFSNVFVYIIVWAILHLTSDTSSTSQIGPHDANKFFQVVMIGLTVGIISSGVFHIFVKEIPHSTSGPITINHRSVSSFFNDQKFYLVAGVYMTTRLFVNIAQICVPLYLHESLKMPATALAVIPLIMYLSSLKMSLIIERINTKLGRKIAYLIGFIQGASACIWIFFGEGQSFTNYFIYPCSLLLGAGGSVMLVTSLGITADLIGKNTQSGAFVYGAMSFTDKMANGVAILLIQYLRCPADCTFYYRNVVSLVCGGSAVLGLIMILCIKNNESDNQDTSEYRGIERDTTYDSEISTPTSAIGVNFN